MLGFGLLAAWSELGGSTQPASTPLARWEVPPRQPPPHWLRGSPARTELVNAGQLWMAPVGHPRTPQKRDSARGGAPHGP